LAGETWHMRLSEGAVGEDHTFVPLGRDPVRTHGGEVPAAVAWFKARHACLEPKKCGKTEVIGVLLEVLAQHSVARVVGGGAHRELGELGRRARRDEVR